MSRFITEAGRMVADVAARTADDGRLSRGRALFRKGAVADLTIVEGSIMASVRGSEGNRYASSVGTSPAPPGVVRQVIQALTDGETVDALIEDGINVCPREIDLGFDCECADWDEPCKHVVALLLAFADRVDLDVDELLRWRGVDPQPLTNDTEPTEVVDRAKSSNRSAAKTPPPTEDSTDTEWFDEAYERSERLADLKKLLGNTALQPSRSRDRADGAEQPGTPISVELSAFLGMESTIEVPDLNPVVSPAPLFAELLLGPLADLGPQFALALATVANLLGAEDPPDVDVGPSISPD